MLRIAAAALGCAALSASAGAGFAAGLPAELARAAAAYDQAQIHDDRAALGRLLADDYTLVNSRGEVSSKAEFIRDSTRPGYHIDPFTVRDPIEKVWDDAAVLGGVVALSGVDDGRKFATALRFADVWARRHGAWQVIYTEVTRAASQPRQPQP